MTDELSAPARTTGKVISLELRRPSASADTVQCLEQLLDMARRGELTGIAFVAMRKGRNFIAHATGETYRNPTFTRGMLRELDDELSRIR